MSAGKPLHLAVGTGASADGNKQTDMEEHGKMMVR